MNEIRVHICVTGRVQQVGFRYFSQYVAVECALTGWVRNIADGSVELQLQGKEKNVWRAIQKIKEGNQYIRIDNLDQLQIETVPEQNFRIVY